MKKSKLNVRPQAKFDLNKVAQKLECPYKREDLIVSDSLNNQIDDLISVITKRPLLSDWGNSTKLKPGYSILFHGPPGTGKTLTASLLGKYTGRDVYRIDLSLIVSKFIGETEKNLGRLFDKANNKDWILFFDEADALFGKRTEIRNAHDRSTNAETRYLLQALEEYMGIVILATNKIENIDDAFVRRLRYVLNFPKPDINERKKIWEKYFPKYTKEEKVIKQIPVLNKYAVLTGGQIKKSLFKAELLAKQKKESIQLTHLKRSIDEVTAKKDDDK